MSPVDPNNAVDPNHAGDAGAQHGMVHLPSTGSVDDTLRRLEALLTSKGLQTFCRVDHSGEAAKAGLTMRPTVLVIFGSPRGGTPLMIEAPTLALDLPLKALVWQDAGGATWVSHNSTAYLRERHGLQSDAQALAGAEQLLATVAASQ